MNVQDLVPDFDAVTGERNGLPRPPCDECGQPYTRLRKDQRFCSKACSVRWHGRKPTRKTARVMAAAPVTDVTWLRSLLEALASAPPGIDVAVDVDEIHVTITRTDDRS